MVSGLYQAFAAGTELTHAQVAQAVRETLPLSRTMSEQVAELRDWAKTRTRMASSLS